MNIESDTYFYLELETKTRKFIFEAGKAMEKLMKRIIIDKNVKFFKLCFLFSFIVICCVFQTGTYTQHITNKTSY